MAKSYSSIKPLKGGNTFEDDNKPKKSYKDIKASEYDFGVDDKYIKSYLEDVAKYSSEAEKDYNGITYGSDVSGLYDKHFSQTSSLRERGATIRAYLNSRKSSIDEDTYNEFIEALDSHDTFTADTSKAFKQRKDFYTTFKTQYDYDAYVLNNTGDTDSNSVSARKSAYDSITARLAEIDKELAGYTGISFIDNILSDYDTSGHQELIKERDKLKAELTKYDRDKKATDELYTQYSGNEDWGEDSQNRDFNRPRGIDIAQYGTLNIDTGEMYDIDESVVTMEDPLGTYFAFRNGEDGYEWGAVPRPSFDPETEKDTRASQHVDAYNLALEKGREQHWENLSDEEIKLYYYMLSNGLKDQALSYLDGMEIELDRRASVEYQKGLEEASALELVFHNVVSIPANIIGGTTAFVDDVINTVMGNDINPYEGGHAMQNYAQGVRTATANDINKATGASEDDWLTWGDAYQGLMSAADSVAGAAVFGSGYTVLMGMGGAASEAKELYEAGASKGQIIAGSLLAGAAEAAFEKISIGYFLDDVLGKPAKHIGQWLYKTLGMAGVEATEEFCTTIANYISDVTVRGGASDWAALIEGYTNEGYSDGEAIWRAIKEVGGEALHDGVIGAISGGGMGVIGNTVSALQYNSAAKSYGNQIIDAGGVDTLKSLALDMAGEQKGIANFANKLALKQYANEVSKADTTTKKGAKAVGVLADTVDSVKAKQNKGDIKSALIAKGLSKDKAENYANILVAMNEEYFNGNDSSFTLGTDEQWQKMTGDKNAYSVLSEIVTDKNSAVNIRNLAVGNAKRGIRVDAEGKLDETDVAAYQERQTTKMIQAIAEANGLQQDVETDLDVSEDGKVYADTDNGTVEVTSKEFVDSEDGTLKVKVNGDQEVDTSSVSYGNVGEALVVSAIVDMGVGAEDANALYNMFEGVDEKTGQAYAKGISLAFKYGRYFYSPSKLSGIVGISREQAKEAFRIGRESRSKDTKASQAQLNATAEENAKEGKKVSSKGTVVYEGTIADENGNLAAGEGSLTDIQKASVNGLKLIAELSPLNFHLFQSEKDGDTYTYVKKNGEETHANGWYRVGTNDIYIDLNAGITGEGTVMYTAAHEISHFIKQYSPEKWDKIAEYIMNEYCAHYGGKVDALLLKHITAIKARPDANTKTQKEIEDEAFEDLVCDSLSRMLIDGTVVEAMANIKKKDKGVWNAIKNAVLKLLDKWGVVIDQYKGRNPDAEEAGYFRETSKAFKKLQGMLTEAFVDAGDTYSKVGNLKSEQSEVLSDRATAEESKAIKSLGKGADVERNENGDMLVATNKDGSTVMYSERTWRMGGKEKFIATMKSLGHGEQAQEYAKYLDDALGYLHELAVGYEILGQHLDADIVTDIKNGKQVLSAIVNNGEYPVNIDLALICKKRVAYMRLMAKMIEDGVFGDVKYDGDAIAEVNKILRKNGFETACLGCFVESRRLQFQTWAETIVQEWNEAVEARNKYAHYFRFADGKASLTDEEIEALDKELASGGKKNDKGNLNLGQGSVSAKMSRLLDKVPSLARKLTVDDLLTPQGLTALRATDSNLFSLVKQRYGAASPKIVQDYNPYASEIADLTFNFVKKVTGNNVKGAQDYIKQAKKEIGDAPKKLKGESKEDFKKRKEEYDAKVEALAMQKYLYSIGGARIQSFSDFMIENVFDYLQIFADLAAKELPMHGYTKEVVALRLFGMSGAKWNGSLIAHVEKSMGKEYAGLLPASEAKNGNGILVKVDGKDYCIAFDDYARNKATNGESFIQSIGMKDIVALMYDPRYSPYVGNITIGVSDKQIMAMLDSPLFRMVIPYHASGMLPQFAQLVGVDMYNDYTNYQNTTVREIRLLNDTDYTVKIGDNGKPKVVKKADGKDVGINTHYAFNDKLQKYGDARKTCQDYLAWCKNEHPIYDKGKVIGFATYNAKFSDSPTGVDFTKHRNYYKLIEDFNTYDNITEKATPQGAVTMTFPSAENRLSAEQKSAYEKALRDTGIFTDADIKKYLKKADMTFEEIVREEVGNRKAYNDATEPKFDSTVKEVEDYLLNAKDDKGNYKFRRDSIADTASDYIEAKNHGISLKPATGSYMDEVKNSDRKSLAKKGRTPYNEFASVAMQWANSNTTKVGDAKIIYDGRRDKYVLIEASVNGYIENASGNYERVRSLYEQAHREADNDIYADLDQARTRRGRGVWDLQPAEDGGYDVRDVRSSGSKGLQTDSARDDEHLRRGNQRESVKESSRQKAPTFYSYMGVVVDGVKQEKLGATSVINLLKGKGVKDEEIKWSGIETWLEGKKSVTKAELQGFIAVSQLQIGEQMSSNDIDLRYDTNSATYTLYDKDGNVINTYTYNEFVGGYVSENDDEIYTNYTELEDALREEYGSMSSPRWSDYKLDGGSNYREIVFTMPNSSYSNKMMRVHWGEDAEGVLAHARIQDFYVNGQKMLFVEEIQSDWHNEGHKSGYRDLGAEDKHTVSQKMDKFREAFFESSIAKVFEEKISAVGYEGAGVYMMLNYLLDETDYTLDVLRRKGVSLTDSEKSEIDRYVREYGELEKQWEAAPGDLTAPDAPFRNNYHEYVLKRLLRMAAEDGYDSIGWTTADTQMDRWNPERKTNREMGIKDAKNPDAIAFEEGYGIEYDQDIPKFLRKYGKKWGATVGSATVSGEIDVWSMPITDSMKDSVLYEGQVLYQDRNSNSLSSRALLANALESTIDTSTQEGQNELKKLKEYKEMIGTLDELSYKLTNLRNALFSPGITGEERKKIQEEATKTANRISVYDKKLLTLEASKPLKKVLDREKALAVKRQKAIDAENMAAYRKASEAKLKEQAEYYQKSREKAVERVKETRAKSEAKAKLQKLVLDTAKWISYPKKGDVKCPDILRAPYADFLKGIDFSSKTLLEKGEQTKNDMRMIMAMDSLATAVERIQTAQNPETENAEALDIGYLDLPPNFVKLLREMAEKVKGMMINGDYVINQMASVDIKQLTRLIRTLNHSIKEMSTLYSNLRFARVEELGDNSISFMEEIGEVESTSGAGDFFAWDNALPYYVFKRFGKAGESLFEELMDAQDKLAFLADEIIKFREKAWNDAESKAWSEDTHTIELPSGKEIILTTADAMSIYCLYRRDNNQGLNHLVGGGVRVIGAKDGAKQAKDSKVELDIDDVLAICDTLDDRPKAVAEAIQEYMSTVCSEWGNEISMKRFLTKDFVEKRYFPIQSNDEALAVRDPQAQQSDLYRLLNISATKPLTPNANNSVIIRNIFDVFTEHTSDMARLNAYGMALLDYMKWVNYNEKTKNEKGQINIRGVRSAMNSAYGKKAQSYIIGLVKDINGRFNDGGDHPFLMKMTRYAKTASVGANLRVAALQFTAYPRASMVLSTANLAKGLSKKPQISKARKYCGVALWKSFGFYDTNIARSIEDQIKGTTNWRQKLIELSLKPAEWGDSITWGFLWNACEYDVANSNKQLKVGSEEFNQAVAKRLREVIYSTQVVDSVLTRSQIMRNKSGLTQTATAFMSEPTLTSNILMDAGFQFYLEKRRTGSAKAAWAKTGKHITKTATVFGATSVIIAIAESLADAFRDDDEEEFIAKFGEAMLENSVSNLLIFNKIPIVADVMEGLLSLIGLGYFSTDRLDTVWLADIVKAGETWIKVLGEAFGTKNTSVTVYKALYDTAKAFSSSTGVPVSGLLRELVTLWNNTAGAANPDLKIKKYDD